MSNDSNANDFVRQAGQRQTGIVGEFVQFLRESRKWWLIPIIVGLMAMGALVLAAGSGAAPFIYALF